MSVPQDETRWVDAVREAVRPDAVRQGADAAAYAVDGKLPLAAVLPETAEEAAAVLRVAGQTGIGVCPIGGRCHLHLGNPPSRYGLALSLERLCRRVVHEPAELVVTTDAGVPVAELQRVLAAQGQWLPVDAPAVPPPGAPGPTVGGLLAADLSGPCRLRYGGLRDQLLGVRVVLADGSLVRSGGRVMKNVAGYDLCRILTGSLGTLGVIVEATFRVQPRPEAWRVVVAPCSGLARASAALDALAASELLPTFAELERTAGTWQLWVGFEGCAEAAAWQDARAREILSGARLAPEAVGENGWQQARRSLDRIAAPAPDAVVCRISLPGSHLTSLLAELDAAWPAWAHALLGVVRVRLPAARDVANAVARLRERAAAREGSLVVEAAPTCLKPGLQVWGPERPDFRLMRAVKERFDPRGILNPGRFVGGI